MADTIDGSWNRRKLFKLLLTGPLLLSRSSLRAQSAPAAHVLASDAGMILNTIKPEKTGDFEMIVGRLKAALAASNDPLRKQQAAGWKVFKAVEPGGNNTVLYVFWINPAVKGADYTISKILYEAFPNEARDLYEKFSGAYGGGQTIVNLQFLSTMAPQAG